MQFPRVARPCPSRRLHSIMSALDAVDGSSKSWEPQTAHTSWHSRARGGVIHSINTGRRNPTHRLVGAAGSARMGRLNPFPGPRSLWPLAVSCRVQSQDWLSAAASKATFPDGIARLLAFAEELYIRHDRLVGMFRLPMHDVCLVIGNADHQTRSARAPITGSPHRTGGLVEQVLQVRHGHLPRLLQRARFRMRSAADCPALAGY